MTKENKILLAKAIGESLYSGIICTDSRHGDSVITDFEWDAKTCEGIVYCFDFDEYVRIDDVKLYLRPMSSMTDEEFSEMKQAYLNCSQDMTYAIFGGIDWLNKHHFDYRGLIEKGLALEAHEDMYKTE